MLQLAIVVALALRSAMLFASPSPTAAPSVSVAPTAAPTATQLPSHGGAFITTLPEGAEVWVDGQYAGRSPAYIDLLTPGKHAFTISRTGWQAQTASTDIAVGHVTMIALVLEKATRAPAQASKGEGALFVRGSPVGASVFVDGSKIGTLPVAGSSKVKAGFHIVSVVPKSGDHLLRAVEVYPDTTTSIAVNLTSARSNPEAEEILAPASSFLPPEAIARSGDQITIHYRGVQVKCRLGSRSYTYNGKAGTLEISPALVAGKLYLPQSLLQKIRGVK
jgi:hypothetical protein